jgi:hypothetical protein
MENHGKMYKNVIHIFECGEMSSIFLNVVDFHGGFSSSPCLMTANYGVFRISTPRIRRHADVQDVLCFSCRTPSGLVWFGPESQGISY